MEENKVNPVAKPLYVVIISAIALIILVLIVRPFTGNDNQIPPGSESPLDSQAIEETTLSVTPTPTSVVTSTTGEVKKFTVTGSDFSFSPSMMRVSQGDQVEITFKNTVGTHDLVVDGYEVRTKIIPAGTEETITFVADQKGEFEFYCSVANHRQMGMKGTLIVE